MQEAGEVGEDIQEVGEIETLCKRWALWKRYQRGLGGGREHAGCGGGGRPHARGGGGGR